MLYLRAAAGRYDSVIVIERMAVPGSRARIGSRGLIASSASIPAVTLPNTVCRPFRWG